MKVKLIKSCTYHAHPFIFSKTNKVEDVPKDFGEHLLQTGYFEKVKGELAKETEDTKEENTKKEPKEVKVYKDTKKDPKKKK